MKKYVLLADCIAETVQSLCDALVYEGHGFQTESYIANWRRTGMYSELKRYAKYFYVGFLCFLKRRKYGAIIGWQQFYALIFCFFCAVFHVKKTTFVVALNYTYKPKKGKIAGLYRWFMQKCMTETYLDYIHVLSTDYANIIAEEFSFPRERILVTGFGVNDCYEEFSRIPAPALYPKEGYALAIGRSNRDYDFLIHAWKEIDCPLVIISDTYKGTTDADNIAILRDVAGRESYPWIANCALMIVPIDDGTICSGDTVLLTAMAAKRKIIVTTPSTLAEMYVIHGENALSVPKDPILFRNTVMDALYKEEYKNMGNRARNSFLQNYSIRSMGEKISMMMK